MGGYIPNFSLPGHLDVKFLCNNNFIKFFGHPVRAQKWLKNSNFMQLFSGFLVACMRLYTPLCPSVGLSVGRSHFTNTYYQLSKIDILLYSNRQVPCFCMTVDGNICVSLGAKIKKWKCVKLNDYTKMIIEISHTRYFLYASHLTMKKTYR